MHQRQAQRLAEPGSLRDRIEHVADVPGKISSARDRGLHVGLTFDTSVTFFDTSRVAARRAAERRVGQEILTDYPRRLVGGSRPALHPDVGQGPRAPVVAAARADRSGSLKHPRMDHINLCQCPSLDNQYPAGGGGSLADPGGQEDRRGALDQLHGGRRRRASRRRWRCQGWRSSSPARRSCSALMGVPQAEVVALCQPERFSRIVSSPLAQDVLNGRPPRRAQ